MVTNFNMLFNTNNNIETFRFRQTCRFKKICEKYIRVEVAGKSSSFVNKWVSEILGLG